MKGICAVLGLALLMGCGNSRDCPRKKKDCGNDLAKESPLTEQRVVAQEDASVIKPSK